MLKTLVPAATLAASLLAAPFSPAAALQLAPIEHSETSIIQVYGGCGPVGHRGPYGGCRAGGQWGGYVPGQACPWGWHVGPYGRHCWRNS